MINKVRMLLLDELKVEDLEFNTKLITTAISKTYKTTWANSAPKARLPKEKWTHTRWKNHAKATWWGMMPSQRSKKDKLNKSKFWTHSKLSLQPSWRHLKMILFYNWKTASSAVLQGRRLSGWTSWWDCRNFENSRRCWQLWSYRLPTEEKTILSLKSRSRKHLRKH